MIHRLGPKPEYLQTLCKLYTQGGFFEEGKATCRQGILADEKDPRNYVNLAVCFRDTGHKDEAKNLMERSAANFPKSEDYTKALTYYQAALVANPKSLEALLSMASCQLELQKFKEAYETYQKACSLSRRTLTDVRHAIAILRLAKAPQWLEKFDVLSETCASHLSN